MLKKSILTGKDIDLYLLDYRSTPVAGLEYTHSELLMTKKIKTKLPINEKLLYPQIPIEAYAKMLAKQNTQNVSTYDKNVRIKENKFAVNDSINTYNILF